jgi:hypothetical protein
MRPLRQKHVAKSSAHLVTIVHLMLEYVTFLTRQLAEFIFVFKTSFLT